MKFLNKLSYIALAGLFGLASCEKVDELPFYNDGKAPQVTTSTATVAPPPTDADKVVLTVNWTSPDYATDPKTYKYMVQIDVNGRNFASPATRTLTGVLTTSYTGKELNDILLGFGFEFNKAYDVDVRVVSSYGNNNEQYTSNIVKIKATPYKVPPKVPIPNTGKLFIIGSATVNTNPTNGGWQNPVPLPVHEFTRIDETTFGGIFLLEGASEFLILPQNGSWDRKLAVPGGGANTVTGGDFAFYDTGVPGGDNFVGPAAKGLYKIIFNFQTGKYTITAYTQQHGLPDKLALVGNATSAPEWENKPDNPQTFTRLNSTAWTMTINLKSGREYLILPVPGNWDYKYGVDDNSIEAAKLGGVFKPQGSNFKSPNDAGNYRIDLNFIDNSYKLTKL